MSSSHFPSPSPTVLLPHLPPKTLVGIDLITFTSTANFHGIRDLPNGWHFLYTGTTELLSLRCGGWFYVGDSAPESNASEPLAVARQQHRTSDVIIWRWNSNSETLEPLSLDNHADQQEAMRYKANLGAIWQRGGLFGYRSRVSVPSLPLSTPGESQQARPIPKLDAFDEEVEKEGKKDWQGLTDRLSPQLLTRIVGEPSVDIDGRPRWTITTASAAERDSDDIPGLSALDDQLGAAGSRDQEKELSFIPIDLKITWREGAVGRERTEAARDRSWALGNLIQKLSEGGGLGEAQVLGELQFTFLMGMTLMNYSCLQQWKRLLRLILTCRSAIVDRELFMRDVLRLLLLQLKRCDDVEGGLFDIDGEDGSDFLRKLLRSFRGVLYEVTDGAESSVKVEFRLLEEWVKEEYDWELDRDAVVQRGMLQLEDGEQVEMALNDDNADDETGEYAPVVVDLGDSGMTPEGSPR